MRRLAGCLVVSLLASAAAWVGCRDDLGDEDLLLAGSGTAAPDAIVVIDDAVVLADGSGGAVPDAGSGSAGPDAIVVIDDAVVLADGSGGAVPDAGIGEGSGSDA